LCPRLPPRHAVAVERVGCEHGGGGGVAARREPLEFSDLREQAVVVAVARATLKHAMQKLGLVRVRVGVGV
jgi:hypothetical protein